jgi:hypothetical protein
MVFLPSCSSPERPNYLLNEDIKAGMYIEGLRLEDMSQTLDFHNISGYVGIAIRNIPLNASKIFVYVDHVQIGRWVRGYEELELIGFESNRFSNGWHKVKLVSINLDGEVTNHPPIDAHFNNLLYKVIADDYFHSTEDKEISGFYDGNSPIEAKVTNIDGEVIWSNIYSPDKYISIKVPGAAFGDEQLCKLTITEAGGVAADGTSAVTSGSSSTTITLAKKFRKEDWPYDEAETIDFFYADKYFVPPTDKTVAILWYPPYSDSGNYQPLALFGDKEITEKLMGESLEPIIIKGRDWLEKIMDVYKTALKEAEEGEFHRDGYTGYTLGQVIFVTPENGYMRAIDVDFDANTVCDNYMESRRLKECFDELFDELGLTKESSSGETEKLKVERKRIAEREAEAQRKIEEANWPK